VAVKALHPHLVADPEARARLARELTAARKVARFCTARVVAADVVAPVPYVVTEFVAGPTLYRRVVENGPLTGDALERLAVGVATALVVIHRAHVVHRDLKPHNVILSPDGPRVIDFGIAQAPDGTTSLPGYVIGTPGYLAPEYATGGEIGPAADIFAWAATVAWAATGKPVFGYGPPLEVIGRAVHGEPVLANLPPLLDELVRAGLAKDPAARPNAEQLLSRLLAADADNEPTTEIVRPTPVERGALASASLAPTPAAAAPTRTGWLHDWQTWLAVALGSTLGWLVLAVSVVFDQPNGGFALVGLVPIFLAYRVAAGRTGWPIAAPLGLLALALCEGYLIRLGLDRNAGLVRLLPMWILHPLSIAAVARSTRLVLRPDGSAGPNGPAGA
jgi:hypothetical protein